MPFLVQKYGGTSVGSPERIRSAARQIAARHSEGHDLVVVVSAMGHTTDELLDLARQVSDHPPHREVDMLLTAGERISMALLSMALCDLGVPARSFTGSQTGIITDPSHRRAKIKRILGDRVREAIRQRQVAIVAGFQGVSETKDVTTLGRGGSDTTAVALAAALGADKCEIYTDVDGVFSADPRRVPEARFLSQLPDHLMLELAYRGAGVLHPRSVELARKYRVPVWVKNSLKETEGTLVMPKESFSQQEMEQFKFVGVTADEGRIPVEVQLARPSVLAAVLDHAHQAGLTVTAPFFKDSSLWFFVEKDAQEEWKKHLEQRVVQEFVREYKFHWDFVPVSLVGECLSQDGTAFCRLVEALSRDSVPILFSVSSAMSITAAVPEVKSKDAVAAIHQEFIGKEASK